MSKGRSMWKDGHTILTWKTYRTWTGNCNVSRRPSQLQFKPRRACCESLQPTEAHRWPKVSCLLLSLRTFMWALSLLVMTIYVRSLHAFQCSVCHHSTGRVFDGCKAKSASQQAYPSCVELLNYPSPKTWNDMLTNLVQPSHTDTDHGLGTGRMGQ